MHTTESEFFNFMIKYVAEIETEFRVRMDSNHKKIETESLVTHSLFKHNFYIYLGMKTSEMMKAGFVLNFICIGRRTRQLIICTVLVIGLSY